MKTLLVTGGAGFIGGTFVRKFVSDSVKIINLDALTYAGNLESLISVEGHKNSVFVQGDIRDESLLAGLLAKYQPDGIIHFAAESHVDRSIGAPAEFISTNVVGTQNLLESARAYWNGLGKAGKSDFRFLHVSTDEVYGSLGETGLFTEETRYAPNSPYAASKAASDHLVRAYFHTYGMPTLISNCSNNYGPYQFPEKLIPLQILNAVENKELPVYGDGSNVRDWLHVEDHCDALFAVLDHGRPGEVYNIGGGAERTNLQVVTAICDLMDELRPLDAVSTYHDLIRFVQDRPGHDQRYAIDSSKIRAELGWMPRYTFETGLRRTLEWYLSSAVWCRSVLSGAYQRERLGLIDESQAVAAKEGSGAAAPRVTTTVADSTSNQTREERFTTDIVEGA